MALAERIAHEIVVSVSLILLHADDSQSARIS
jgi:hypothetical protein